MWANEGRRRRAYFRFSVQVTIVWRVRPCEGRMRYVPTYLPFFVGDAVMDGVV